MAGTEFAVLLIVTKRVMMTMSGSTPFFLTEAENIGKNTALGDEWKRTNRYAI